MSKAFQPGGEEAVLGRGPRRKIKKRTPGPLPSFGMSDLPGQYYCPNHGGCDTVYVNVYTTKAGLRVEIHWHLSEDDFFDGLPEEKKEFIAYARRRTIQKNAFIFVMGDAADSAYYLERGFVKIFRTSPLGKQPIVFIRKRGELFGLAEVMTGGERKCHAQAVVTSQILEIRRENFELILSRHFVLARRLFAVLGRRLRFLSEQIENLMTTDVTTRILRLLIYLCYHELVNSTDWTRPIKVPVRLTQEEIASLTGSCQQTVSEVLRILRQEGLIVVSKREIILVKPQEAIARVF